MHLASCVVSLATGPHRGEHLVVLSAAHVFCLHGTGNRQASKRGNASEHPTIEYKPVRAILALNSPLFLPPEVKVT